MIEPLNRYYALKVGCRSAVLETAQTLNYITGLRRPRDRNCPPVRSPYRALLGTFQVRNCNRCRIIAHIPPQNRERSQRAQTEYELHFCRARRGSEGPRAGHHAWRVVHAGKTEEDPWTVRFCASKPRPSTQGTRGLGARPAARPGRRPHRAIPREPALPVVRPEGHRPGDLDSEPLAIRLGRALQTGGSEQRARLRTLETSRCSCRDSSPTASSAA